MGLRFNSRELAFLAHQSPEKFDKEGVLQVREKQEGLFRKGEVFIDRLFRLRGNLLFYFKTKEPTSEVVGLYILERCVVQLDPDEDLLFSFILDFEDKSVHLAARTERERDSWIESLHIASYECLQMQLQSLRERIREKTGRDPIESCEPLTVVENDVETKYLSETFLEMSITCEGLPEESNGREPDTFASVHFLTPPNPQWITHAHTEISQRCCNPIYLITIGFDDPQAITKDTKIKVIVYDVKERMTNTMTQIGNAQFMLRDLLAAPDRKLQLPLQQKFSYLGLVHDEYMGSQCGKNSVHASGCDGANHVGHVTIAAWESGSQSLDEILSQKSDHVDGPAAPAPPLRSINKRLEMLMPMYDNIVTKTFRFPTNAGAMLSVHECMAESKLTFALPKQLLKLWVEEEKKKVQHLQDLGELVSEWNGFREELADFHLSSITMYMQHARYLGSYQGAPFKPSVKKGHKEVEFAPTNLHLHRIWVQNTTTNTSACYDIITVGAFTAYPHKFKHGGLRRLLQQLKEHVTEVEEGKTRLERASEVLANMEAVRAEVDELCEALCRAAMNSEAAELQGCAKRLADKTHQLVQVCEDNLVEEGITECLRACAGKVNPKQRPQSEPFVSAVHQGGGRSAAKSWKWSGTDFVKSPTEEPWELTRLNTEASMVCICSQVDELDEVEATQWLAEVSPLVIKYKRCIEVMCSRARASLTFLTIKECGPNVALMHSIKYRRDVVFSQALTSAVAGFMTKFRSDFTDENFLKQLVNIGILLNFESLLSCHSDELGMLEDMAVGVNDLEKVTFKVKLADSPEDATPEVTGTRANCTVFIPVTEHMFKSLPREIQRGHRIKVTSVMFSIGINEQATLAERFGDTTVQEAVNIENYSKLYTYYEKFEEIMGSPSSGGKNALPLEQLLRHLHINIMSKKNKNVDSLHLAAEICRKLNGIRFVSCKSAKDRTAMGVTLECVQILQREQDLASHIFLHALECLRSEGVRRENTVKNAGTRKYAFNSLQLLSIPKLYRPPSGTFGNVQT